MKKQIGFIVALSLVVCMSIAFGQYTPRSAEGGSTVTAQTTTSNSAMTLVGDINSWSGTANVTNVTLTAPAAAGITAKIYNGDDASDLTIAKGSTLIGETTTTLQVGETMEVFSISTSYWVQVGYTE